MADRPATEPDARPTTLKIVSLGGSVYSIEDEQGRLGRVMLDWDGKWAAHREGGGPIRGSHGYGHRTRREAIELLRGATR